MSISTEERIKWLSNQSAMPFGVITRTRSSHNKHEERTMLVAIHHDNWRNDHSFPTKNGTGTGSLDRMIVGKLGVGRWLVDILALSNNSDAWVDVEDEYERNSQATKVLCREWKSIRYSLRQLVNSGQSLDLVSSFSHDTLGLALIDDSKNADHYAEFRIPATKDSLEDSKIDKVVLSFEPPLERGSSIGWQNDSGSGSGSGSGDEDLCYGSIPRGMGRKSRSSKDKNESTSAVELINHDESIERWRDTVIASHTV